MKKGWDNLKNNKVLFITYYFPPIKAIGSLRPYFLSKNLIKKGWDVFIFTTKGHKFLQNDDCLLKLKKAMYVYLPSFDLQMLKNIIGKRNNKNSTVIKNNTKSSFFQKLRNSFPLNIHYEGGLIYIFFGIIYGIYYIKKYDIRYIYSTFSPLSNHIMAYFIKLFCKNCYWVADFRDLPFGDSDNEIYFKSFQRRINNLIFKKSDVIVTISEGLKSSLKKYNSNIHVINNGFEVEIDKTKYKKQEKEKIFNIVYTGALYTGKRDASILFKAIRELIDHKKISNDIRIIYAGKDGNTWQGWTKKYSLEDYADIKGELTASEAKLLQRKASINLMLTWATKKEKGILTGKFYEYLNAQKPILCLINGDKDREIEQKFKELNCGYVIYDDEKELKNIIELNYVNWQKNMIENMYNTEELKKYSYENLSKELSDIFQAKDKNV